MANNYSQYIERMTRSYDRTTKSLIPYYTIQVTAGMEAPRVLDVGLGSGVVGQAVRAVLPNAVIHGIDMVQGNIDHAPEGAYDHLVCCKLEEAEDEPSLGQYDVIIFSSVLHEISSYSDGKPAEEIGPALEQAARLTKPGGHIIIRDGLDTWDRSDVPVRLSTQADLDALRRFCEETVLFDKTSDRPEEARKRAIDKIGEGLAFDFPVNVFREFLCTWTWGPASWDREIREQFLCLPATEWQRIMSAAGFDTIANIQSFEEYPKYFERIGGLVTYETPFIGVFVGKKRVD